MAEIIVTTHSYIIAQILILKLVDKDNCFQCEPQVGVHSKICYYFAQNRQLACYISETAYIKNTCKLNHLLSIAFTTHPKDKINLVIFGCFHECFRF